MFFHRNHLRRIRLSQQLEATKDRISLNYPFIQLIQEHEKMREVPIVDTVNRQMWILQTVKSRQQNAPPSR
jgi:hypothetical protein